MFWHASPLALFYRDQFSNFPKVFVEKFLGAHIVRKYQNETMFLHVEAVKTTYQQQSETIGRVKFIVTIHFLNFNARYALYNTNPSFI